MTTPREMNKMKNMVDVIEDAGSINKVQLIIKSGISISYYDKLKPFMEEYFKHRVCYDKQTKLWYSIKQEQIPVD